MAESATILIPDISGYTESLTKTELVHSSHIINELLEAILAANGRREGRMDIELTRSFLLWCINYGILVVWFLVFVQAHDALHRIHGRWFRLSREQFDGLHTAG